jgi:hypothetical protein
MMNDLFNLCVELLHILKVPFEMTYQEINIWIFVIIHPLLTLMFFTLWVHVRAKNKAFSNVKMSKDQN